MNMSLKSFMFKTMAKAMPLSAMLALALSSSVAFADPMTELTQKAQQDQQAEQQHNQQRIEKSAENLAELEQKRQQLLAQKQQFEQQIQALNVTFEQNEKALAEKESELTLASNTLGELYGTVRQATQELQQNYQSSFLSEQELQTDPAWQSLQQTNPLPTIEQIELLTSAMKEKIQTSSQLTSLTIPYIQGDGKVVSAEAIRLGDMGLITENSYVAWDFERQQAHSYDALPSNAPSLNNLPNLLNQSQAILLDPTRGELLNNFAQKPNLWQRIALAGGVGKVIILLLLIGLGIAFYRGFELWKIKKQVKQQLKQPEQITDNPLGRILSVFDQGKKQSIETLELRLLESILDEQQGLERGLSMLKLLAALAPMLGLLGTVTGMIETFQVITQFGNGDPQIMAGGISMALMTTVLGLIAAMPLLLAHNILSSNAEEIHSTLEKQGVSLVARRAEQEQVLEITTGQSSTGQSSTGQSLTGQNA